jgi:hypothetical protein
MRIKTTQSNDPSARPAPPAAENGGSMFLRRAAVPVLLFICFVPIGHTLLLALVAGALSVGAAVRRGLEKGGGKGDGAGTGWSSAVAYAALCVTALAITIGTHRLARHRANQIIVAVEHYKLDHGVYPDRLAALVPQYLATIPRASYSFFGDFSYHNLRSGEPAVWLDYITVPPFEGPTYRFDLRTWSDEPEQQPAPGK